MEKYNYNGEIYYYKAGKWLDANLVSVPVVLVNELNKLILNPETIEEDDMEYLLRIVYGARREENYQLAAMALEETMRRAIENDQIRLIRNLLPVLTSNYRKMNRPKKAINESRRILDVYGKKIWSAALFTSIAGAYCDIDEYEVARKFADIAQWMVGDDTSNKLANIYERITR